jgi:hypothetical protein
MRPPTSLRSRQNAPVAPPSGLRARRPGSVRPRLTGAAPESVQVQPHRRRRVGLGGKLPYRTAPAMHLSHRCDWHPKKCKGRGVVLRVPGESLRRAGAAADLIYGCAHLGRSGPYVSAGRGPSGAGFSRSGEIDRAAECHKSVILESVTATSVQRLPHSIRTTDKGGSAGATTAAELPWLFPRLQTSAWICGGPILASSSGGERWTYASASASPRRIWRRVKW